MSTVKRCDVCKTVSTSWHPTGWKVVTNISVLSFHPLNGEQNVCDECWQFLETERTNLHA